MKNISRPAWPITLSFILISYDSLINYFLKQFYQSIPVNLSIIFILPFLIFLGKLKTIVPETTIIMWLTVVSFGYLLGVYTANDIDGSRVIETFSAILAFLVGYGFFKNNNDEDHIGNILLLVSLPYIFVCVLALMSIHPYFPVINQEWAQNGILISRPEVTTDQNFQIFYIFPVVLVLVLPFKFWRFLLTIIGIIGSLFVLAKLQTRSGTLVLIGAIGFSLLTPLFRRELGRIKIPIIIILGITGVIMTLPLIIQEADLLLSRFNQDSFKTGNGRLHSLLYFFEIALDPSYWIPQGNGEYMSVSNGYKPHSNITAVFLEGGILSLCGWLALVLIPVVRLSRLLVNRTLSNSSVIVFVGCVVVFVCQLSLNVPLMDQVWLWSGVSVGLYEKERLLILANKSKQKLV